MENSVAMHLGHVTLYIRRKFSKLQTYLTLARRDAFTKDGRLFIVRIPRATFPAEYGSERTPEDI